MPTPDTTPLTHEQAERRLAGASQQIREIVAEHWHDVQGDRHYKPLIKILGWGSAEPDCAIAVHGFFVSPHATAQPTTEPRVIVYAGSEGTDDEGLYVAEVTNPYAPDVEKIYKLHEGSAADQAVVTLQYGHVAIERICEIKAEYEES